MLSLGGFTAVGSLLLTAATVFVLPVFALLLFFPLFLLVLLGLLTKVGDRTVDQHNPSTNGGDWRNP